MGFERTARMQVCETLLASYTKENKNLAIWKYQQSISTSVGRGEIKWQDSMFHWLLACYSKLELEKGGEMPEYSWVLAQQLFDEEFVNPGKNLKLHHAKLLQNAKWEKPDVAN